MPKRPNTALTSNTRGDDAVEPGREAVWLREPRMQLLLSLDAAAQALGVRRTLLMKHIYSGQLPSVMLGRRRLVAADDLRDFVDGLRRSGGAVVATPPHRPA